MNLLAIDTSTDIASVALRWKGEVLHQEQSSQKTHALRLLPMIDELLKTAEVSLTQLDAIAFGCGPGSFTGLRIACSMAKGLAYPHELGLIPVSTLGCIAYEARLQKDHEQSPVLAVLDARMQQMYWSYFPKATLLAEDKVTAVKDIHLPNQTPLVLAGLGIDAYWDHFPESIQSQVSAKLKLYPKAATMIELALAAGLKPISAAKAKPVYVRNQVTFNGK